MDHGNRDISSSSSSGKRRRGHGENARPWSDIPLDVICNVLRRLSIGDFVRCGAVCACWRSATLQRQCRPMLAPPWVIPFWYAGSRGIVCPPERRLRTVPSIPWDMIRRSEYLGSSNGWLGIQRIESVRILHALSGTVLQLPDLTAIAGVKLVKNYDRGGRWQPELLFPLRGKGGGYTRRGWYSMKHGSPFFDGILIVPPPVGDDHEQLTIFALCSHMQRLLFARPGDVSWSLVDMPTPLDDFVIDLTCHQGSVYAVDCSGCVAAWDYCCSNRRNADALALGPRFTRIVVSSGPPPSALLVQRYLVAEANGGLLQLERMVEANVRGSYKMVGVHAFRREQSGGGEGEGTVWWQRLQHLGHSGAAVFAGRGISAVFTCNDFPWLWRNCIYFKEGVYNLCTQEMQVFPFNDRWFHGDWLVPT